MREDAVGEWVNSLRVDSGSGFCPPYPDVVSNINWLIGLTGLP